MKLFSGLLVWCSCFVFGQDGLLGTSLPPGYVPFSPESPFNQPIPPDAEADALNDQMIAQLKKAGPLKGDMTRWTVPLFVIDAAVSPKASIRAKGKTFHPDVDPNGYGFVDDIPMPAGIWPDPEKDGHMLLVDPKLQRAWDFSRLEQYDDSWVASRLDIWDLSGDGFRRAFRGKKWWLGGARASGFPLIAGLIRPEQIEAGEIGHALVFACPDIRKSTYVDGESQVCSPPASRTDGSKIGFEYIPMGARLQLDPLLDLTQLKLSPGSLVIATALQRYGMFLCDGSETVKLYFQNLGNDSEWQRLGGFNDLRRIPLERFRVLRCSLRLDISKRK